MIDEELNKIYGTVHADEDEKKRFDNEYKLPALKNYGKPDFMSSIYGMIKNHQLFPDTQQELSDSGFVKAVMESNVPHKFLPQNQEYDKNHLGILYAQATGYVRGLEKNLGRNAYMYGPSFIGKSNLAARILLDALNTIRPGYWLNLPAYCEAVKNFRGDVQRITDEWTEKAKAAKVLVMDDFGKEYEKYMDEKSLSFFGQKLYSILEERRGRATIFTAEFAPDELRSKLTDAVINRAVENVLILDMRKIKKWGVDP